jgi:DNA-binding YbaB/EbfC family protein
MQSFNLEQFVAQTKAMQEHVSQMQTRMDSMRATGQAGDGLVSVTLGARGRVSDVSIDPSLLDPAKREELESLLAEAFTMAGGVLQAAAEEHVRPITDQIGHLTGLGADRL